MAYIIQLRNDTAANWTSANPTLMMGELGYETDTDKLKFGDGLTAWNSLDYHVGDLSSFISSIGFVLDGGGSVLSTGLIKGPIEVPFNCLIQSVTLLADQSGSIAIDIWKDTYANYPPTDADSITASAPPTLSSALKSQDSTLTGWTKTLSAGDILSFNIDSVSTITCITLAIKVVRT